MRLFDFASCAVRVAEACGCDSVVLDARDPVSVVIDFHRPSARIVVRYEAGELNTSRTRRRTYEAIDEALRSAWSYRYEVLSGTPEDEIRTCPPESPKIEGSYVLGLYRDFGFDRERPSR